MHYNHLANTPLNRTIHSPRMAKKSSPTLIHFFFEWPSFALHSWLLGAHWASNPPFVPPASFWPIFCTCEEIIPPQAAPYCCVVIFPFNSLPHKHAGKTPPTTRLLPLCLHQEVQLTSRSHIYLPPAISKKAHQFFLVVPSSTWVNIQTWAALTGKALSLCASVQALTKVCFKGGDSVILFYM